MKEQYPAKQCFSHIGGKLGSLLLDAFVDKGWIAKRTDADKHFFITSKGAKEFKKLGIDITQIEPEKVK